MQSFQSLDTVETILNNVFSSWHDLAMKFYYLLPLLWPYEPRQRAYLCQCTSSDEEKRHDPCYCCALGHGRIEVHRSPNKLEKRLCQNADPPHCLL